MLPDYCLFVQFSEGASKKYDVKTLFEYWEPFKEFQRNPELFSKARVDVGGYGVVWNDDLDLSCDELFENGETVDTPFDNLIALSDGMGSGPNARKSSQIAIKMLERLCLNILKRLMARNFMI